MPRGKLVAGNWKMNGTRAMARAWTLSFAGLANKGGLPCAAAVCVPSILVSTVRESLDGAGLAGLVRVGAEDVSLMPKSGAYTGEVSASMLREAGCSLCIVGHSERRTIFGETDHDTAVKVRNAASEGLAPVLCVGETLAERREGIALDVIGRQLDAVDCKLLAGGAVAYEPLWAIGTGVSAQESEIAPVLAFIAGRLGKAAPGIPVRVLYGGSVKPANAASIMGLPCCDGVLVGGASLDAGMFHAICQAAGKADKQ